jgi:hypothetical protein
MNKSHRPIVGIQRNKMAHKPTPIPVEKGKTCSPTTKSPTLAELARDYQTATEQYGVIVRYLKDAIEVLPKLECQLLLEFAEIEKNHCERLHAELQHRLVPSRRVHNARGQHTSKTIMGSHRASSRRTPRPVVPDESNIHEFHIHQNRSTSTPLPRTS